MSAVINSLSIHRWFSLGIISASLIISPLSWSTPGIHPLEGMWLSACQGGKISQMQIDSQFNSYLREIYYQEAYCKTPLFYIETLGSITYPVEAFGGKSPSPSPVNYLYKEILVTPLSPGIAAQFTQKHFCDYEAWTALVATPITNRLCVFMENARPIKIPHSGQARYGIFAIQEPWLYFGQNNPLEDSSSPARRPSELQKEPFGKRFH